MLIPYPSLRQGLVGCWVPSLGATGLTLLDRSGRNNHGTLTNMGGQNNWRVTAGQLATTLDGINDSILLPNRQEYQFASGSRFTVAAWVYQAAAKNNAIIGYQVNGWMLYIHTGTYIEWAQSGVANAGSTTSTNGVGINHWFHVAVVNTVGSEVQFWINGKNVRTATFTRTYSYAATLQIGNSADLNYNLNGAIDDIRLYSRALTPAEIRLLASRRGIGLSTSGPRLPPLTRSYPIDAPPNRIQANDSGVWVPGNVKANESGVWKNGDTKVNIAGVWK